LRRILRSSLKPLCDSLFALRFHWDVA